MVSVFLILLIGMTMIQYFKLQMTDSLYKKIKVLTLMVSICITSNVYALKTLHVTNLSAVISLIGTLRDDALVMIAVEDVLIYPQDQILQTTNKPEMYKLSMHLQNFYPTQKADEMLSIQLKSRKVRIADPLLYKILATLKSRNIKTIAISNGWSGPYGNIASLEDWQVNELASVGIDFSWSFPNSPSILLGDYITADPSKFPSFRNGVLCTCHMAQGEVFDTFLKKLKWRPGQVFFITSLNRHADSVSYFCQKNNIAFTGMVYKGVSEYTSRDQLNLDRATLQFNTLGTDKVWLSDSEANKLLPHPNKNNANNDQNTKVDNTDDSSEEDASTINSKVNRTDNKNDEALVNDNSLIDLMSIVDQNDTKIKQ